MPSPTTTTRLALTKPDPNPTTGDFLDVTTLNTNFDSLDANIGAVPCTSGTRPASPWHGMLIRETDTRRLYVWNATQTTWDLVADPLVEYGAWTAYTPVWSAITTNPTLGNGTISGRSRTVGKSMSVWLRLTWGSTTSAASTGSWRFSLPAAVLADQLLSVYLDDNSASQRWAGQARLLGAATGDNMRIVVTAGGGAVGGATTPFTWATGDVLILQGSVELA